MDSILNSIKKMLGIEESDTAFNEDIIADINSVFMILQQLGVGPTDGFKITDNAATWNDFMSETTTNIEAVKTYIYLKVKAVFDPSATGAVIEALNRQASELEWRLFVQVDPPYVPPPEEL